MMEMFQKRVRMVERKCTSCTKDAKREEGAGTAEIKVVSNDRTSLFERTARGETSINQITLCVY